MLCARALQRSTFRKKWQDSIRHRQADMCIIKYFSNFKKISSCGSAQIRASRFEWLTENFCISSLCTSVASAHFTGEKYTCHGNCVVAPGCISITRWPQRIILCKLLILKSTLIYRGNPGKIYHWSCMCLNCNTFPFSGSLNITKAGAA